MGDFFIGQKALILNKGNKVLIIKRDNVEAKSEKWDFPGGRLEFGETLALGLSREVKEETGLKLSAILSPLSITTFFKEINRKHQVVRIIYPCKATGKVRLSSEHNEYKWINIKDYTRYDFMEEDYYLAFKRLNELMKLKRLKIGKNKDFLGKGMTAESIEYSEKLTQKT